MQWFEDCCRKVQNVPVPRMPTQWALGCWELPCACWLWGSIWRQLGWISWWAVIYPLLNVPRMSLFFLLFCGIDVFVSPTWMVHLHSALPLGKLMAQVVSASEVFCAWLGRVDRWWKTDFKNQEFLNLRSQLIFLWAICSYTAFMHLVFCSSLKLSNVWISSTLISCYLSSVIW